MLSIDPTHPLLQGNRVFLYPEAVTNADGWIQANPLWAFRTMNGLDANTDWGWNQGAHPSLLTGASSPGGSAAAYYSYWEDVWPDTEVKDFTVIARARYTGADPGGGGGAFIAGARDPGNGGWLFGIWDSGGTDEGISLFLYDQAGNSWVATDQDSISTLIGTPHVYAAVYRSGDREIAFYRSGMRTRTVANTAHDWSPGINATGKQLTVGRADAGFVWPGDIGWVMIFGRALGDAEIQELTRDSEWPFVWEDAPFVLEAASATYTTTVGVGVAFSVTGGDQVDYSSGVYCSAIIDGDLIAGPQPPTVATYRTTVGARSRMFGSEPTLVRYTTTVGVSSVYSPTAPVTYTTTVYVSSRARGLVDGRADLIGTSRYRR